MVDCWSTYIIVGCEHSYQSLIAGLPTLVGCKPPGLSLSDQLASADIILKGANCTLAPRVRLGRVNLGPHFGEKLAGKLAD